VITETIQQEHILISEITDGDQESYRILVDRYHKGLIIHLYNLVHDEQLAEDLAQEAFIKAYQKLSQFNTSYAFSTWLYKIADNIAYRHFKSSKKTSSIDSVEEVLPDDRPSPQEQAELHMTQQSVRDAIQKLEPKYRQIIALYYWDNFSYDEIAQILDRPVGTVKIWLYRAKELLRKELYGQI
jgi:RNA polymerase sigma factor (sigma-70 family)